MNKWFLLVGIILVYPILALAAPDRLLEKLNLNDSQINEIKHDMAQQKQLRSELKDLRRRLNDELAKPNPDTAMVNSLRDTMKAKRDQLTDNQIKNNLEFKQSLNEEQKAELDSFQKQRNKDRQQDREMLQQSREDRSNGRSPDRPNRSEKWEPKN